MATRPRGGGPRGFTILEAVIAMTVMLVGLVGVLSTIVVGTNADRASRAQTLASEAAAELLAGLARLPPDDPRLVPNASSATVPAPFGPLLASDGTVETAGSHAWSDGSPVPGVRPDWELANGQERSLSIERRWVVWEYLPPGAPGGRLVRLISVSVVYQDPFRREVVMYGQRAELGALLVSTIVTG